MRQKCITHIWFNDIPWYVIITQFNIYNSLFREKTFNSKFQRSLYSLLYKFSNSNLILYVGSCTVDAFNPQAGGVRTGALDCAYPGTAGDIPLVKDPFQVTRGTTRQWRL